MKFMRPLLVRVRMREVGAVVSGTKFKILLTVSVIESCFVATKNCVAFTSHLSRVQGPSHKAMSADVCCRVYGQQTGR